MSVAGFTISCIWQWYVRYKKNRQRWAARQIMQDGDVLNWKHIRNLTNMRKSNYLACLPYLQEIADADIQQAIQEVAV